MTSRKATDHTKKSACSLIATGLRDWGYPDVTSEMIEEILDAWLAGKRGNDLPHGLIAAFAESQFNEIETKHPGYMARLP